MDKEIELKVKENILSKYPNSENLIEFVETITKIIKSKNYVPQQVLPGISLCRDDSTSRVYYQLKKKGYPDPFSLECLSGIPLFGFTSLSAKYHHCHNNCDDLPGLIIFGPHIGLDKEGNFGSLNRCGQIKNGASCGANHKLISLWRNHFEIDKNIDLEFWGLNEVLKEHRNIILNNPNPIEKLVEVEYDVGLEMLKQLITEIQITEKHKHPIFLIAGIHIDTPYDKDDINNDDMENFFQIRKILYFDNGEFEEINL